MTVETVEEFLKREGKITTLQSSADVVASKIKGYKCTTHWRCNKNTPLVATHAATVKTKNGYKKIKFR